MQLAFESSGVPALLGSVIEDTRPLTKEITFSFPISTSDYRSVGGTKVWKIHLKNIRNSSHLINQPSHL